MLPTQIKTHIEYYKDYLETFWISRENIKNEEIFMTSFIHKSYTADLPYTLKNNERLEFLWDAVLGCIISKLLFENLEDVPESQLTLYKIALVREENLADVARDINIWSFIFLWHWEDKSNGRDKDSILSDTLEAFLGYLYIDIWIHVVEEFIKEYVYIKMDNISDINIKSYKSSLQEMVQKIYKDTPVYEDLSHEVDDKWNIIMFKSNVYIDNKLIANWYGSNKKKSQEDAAKNAIYELEKE